MTRPKSNTNKRKGSSRSDRANTTRDSGNGDGSDLGSEIVVDDDEDEVEVLDVRYLPDRTYEAPRHTADFATCCLCDYRSDWQSPLPMLA
jgi:hypothetical protein